MARLTTLPLAACAAALVAAAPASAGNGTPLDPVAAQLRPGQSVRQSCDRSQLTRGRRGTGSWTYTPRIGGFLTVRSSGRGDWDLAAYDRRSGRLMAASQGFGAR